MSTGFFKVPQPTNEPIYSYAVGSSERQLLQDTLHTLRNKQVEVSMRIHGKSVQGSRRWP